MKIDFIHQSQNWLKFRRKALNEDFFQLDIPYKDDHKTVFIQKNPLPYGFCWYYLNKVDIDFFPEIFKKLQKRWQKDKAVFLRIEPSNLNTSNSNYNYIKFCDKHNLINAHQTYHPEHTLALDLQLSEEEILKHMKQKGRYNIRLAEKKGVKIEKYENDEQDIKDFYQLLVQTAERDGFKPHKYDYYYLLLNELKDDVKLYVARYEGKVIAGVLIVYYLDTATYYYGASGNKHRNLMAPYLLQWQAIKDAKSKGKKIYDFLGIGPPEDKKHPLCGVNQFKLKFGGQVLGYSKSMEYIFNKPVYYLYRLLKRLKKIF